MWSLATEAWCLLTSYRLSRAWLPRYLWHPWCEMPGEVTHLLQHLDFGEEDCMDKGNLVCFLLCWVHRLQTSREPGFSLNILDTLHCNYVFTCVSYPGNYELLEGRGGIVLTYYQTEACRVGGSVRGGGKGREGGRKVAGWLAGRVRGWEAVSCFETWTVGSDWVQVLVLSLGCCVLGGFI